MNYRNFIKSGCNCVPTFGPGAGVASVFGRHTNGEKK